MGWKSLGLLELTALPSVKEELWIPLLQPTPINHWACLILPFIPTWTKVNDGIVEVISEGHWKLFNPATR
jgi:hypothetical protein